MKSRSCDGWPPNGFRYPLVGETGQRYFAGTNSKPRKLPKNAQTPTSRVHHRRTRTFSFRKETGSTGVYCKWQTHKPYKAVETHNCAVPRCTLVSGQDDPSIGGGRLGAMTPFRKLFPLSDRVCPRQMTKAQRRRLRKWSRRLFLVNLPAIFFLQLLYICFLERCVRRLIDHSRVLPHHSATNSVVRQPS